MTNYKDQSFEVLWLNIIPKKLPRAFSCIILPYIYHPPGANSAAMRDHVINGVDSVVRKHPNCGVLLTGDFNQLNDTFLKTHYRYAQIVKSTNTSWSINTRQDMEEYVTGV